MRLARGHVEPASSTCHFGASPSTAGNTIEINKSASSTHVATDGGKFTTWFGNEASPLFGTLHVPAGGTARGGVVLCPPIGKEHVDSYRGLMLLAQKLCAQGMLVLRFDYLGTGDSSGEQTREDAVQIWESSVVEAAEFLQSCGVREITLVGLRVGALVATSAASRIRDMTTLVLWDPVIRGRTFVQQQKALNRLTAAPDADDPLIPLVGMSVHPLAAQRLSGMNLTALPIDPSIRVLVASRPEHADTARVRQLVESLSADHMNIDGQAPFIEPADFAVQIPWHTVSSLAQWIGDSTRSPRTSVTAHLRHSTTLLNSQFEIPITEYISYAGTNRMLTIRTAPASSIPGGPTLVLYGTASEHRIGPSRLWVELARELAGYGITTIRFDRTSTGETTAAQDREISTIYTPEQRADGVEAARNAGVCPENLVVAGLCSGSWSAAIAAAELGANRAILVNPLRWTTRQLEFTRSQSLAPAECSRGTFALRAHNWAVRFKDKLRDRLPYRVWLALGRIGLVQVPEVLLAPLVQAGVATTVLVSPTDEEWFNENRGRSGVQRLRKAFGTIEIRQLSQGDHALIGPRIRASVHKEMKNSILTTFGIPSSRLLSVPPEALSDSAQETTAAAKSSAFT